MNKKNISVAIIGAGASGTILANQIIERACNEHDVNVVSFGDLAQSRPGLRSENFNKHADYTVFEVNDTDTKVKVISKDGDIITYEFSPIRQ